MHALTNSCSRLATARAQAAAHKQHHILKSSGAPWYLTARNNSPTFKRVVFLRAKRTTHRFWSGLRLASSVTLKPDWFTAGMPAARLIATKYVLANQPWVYWPWKAFNLSAPICFWMSYAMAKWRTSILSHATSHNLRARSLPNCDAMSACTSCPRCSHSAAVLGALQDRRKLPNSTTFSMFATTLWSEVSL